MRTRLKRLAMITGLLLLTVAPSGAARSDALIAALMRNDNAKVRLKAATRLGRFKGPAVVDALSFALADPEGTVRAAAALSLGRLREASGFDALCKARHDPDAFVVRAVKIALGNMGGESACKADHVFVSFDISGDTEPMRALVLAGLTARARSHPRIVVGPSADPSAGTLGPDPRAEVKAGRMQGVELKVRVTRLVQRGGGKTVIKCEMSQAVFDLRLQALRGSATQRGAIELGTENVNEVAIEAQLKACMQAITPVVFEGLTDYLARLR